LKEKIPDMEQAMGKPYKVVANLPYYITTPIVMNFLENARNMLSMTIMVQEEVAARFSAVPSNKDYGAITVGINLRGKAETVMKVPREKFTPAPSVDSAVVRIDIEKDKFAGENLKKVRDCVRVGFSGRRKTIVNNLMNGFNMQRAVAEEVARLADIPPLARAENLSAEQFVSLSHVVEKVQKD
ncbi:MAG: 16S rRNA (adenine(1518)-N(6)/adenine(1519)-N(6))-dimethyltransferase, partial [Clostridia bacterium]|nr:16S rRNA (adenine(1518)-N(6)/adenine(1519)-N(6))-dimethyltransferase [Clostridia bacterium]